MRDDARRFGFANNVVDEQGTSDATASLSRASQMAALHLLRAIH
jgi:hypothetical protein